MLNFGEIIGNSITEFLLDFFENLITTFASILANVMGSAIDTLSIPLVQNGIRYAQMLAFALLVLKAMNEGFQTYILYQNGDPDADPSGLLIRTVQATIIIAVLPWIVTQLFIFGTKVAQDVAELETGKTGIEDWTHILSMVVASKGFVIVSLFIVMVICLLFVALQSTIRGAELALMAVLGPILALNITSNNHSLWSSWFKHVVIICTTQALQLFLLQGAFALLTSGSISSKGIFLSFGWIWVTLKTPKYVQQFAYSTGFSSAVGGTVKQVGTMYIMRKMMTK